jgi:hypothetical protein
MKKLTLFLILLQSAIALAQAPQKMAYQSVVRNANNQIVANQNVGVKISIVEGSITGTIVYAETHTTTTNINGLFTLEAGGGTPTTGTFATINWANGSHYIKSEIDITGGTNYALSGTMELLSVPYALYAKTAGTTSGNTAGFTHYVGELFGGGIVVSVWKKNGEEHGLIASLTNLSTGIQWTTPAFQSTLIGPTAQNYNDGLANTNAIVAQAGAGTSYAAGLCKAYNAGGYADWYLPAINELRQCYISLPIINEILGDINGFPNSGHCSSTEYNINKIWGKDFNFPNDFNSSSKSSSLLLVRAVRRF